MFVVMNRFHINQGFEETFEAMWRARESQLDMQPGFCGFRLLKGQDNGEGRLYASYTQWASRADFDAWREFDAFRQAHAQAKAPQGTYAGHPAFEGFEGVLEEAVR